jgi:hypothetical protein
MAETTEMDEMPKIVESKQTEGLDGLAVETDDYFIINQKRTYISIHGHRKYIEGVFITDLYINPLIQKETGSLSFFSMLIFIVYFAAFAGVSYALFTNVLVKDGTIQSVELIRSIMIWFALLFAIIVFVHKD